MLGKINANVYVLCFLDTPTADEYYFEELSRENEFVTGFKNLENAKNFPFQNKKERIANSFPHIEITVYINGYFCI